MVCHVLFEGQGWSPDHPDQLLLSLILARASKLLRAKPMMVCGIIEIFRKLNVRKKIEAGMEPYTVTIVGTEVFLRNSEVCLVYDVFLYAVPMMLYCQ